MFLQSRAKLNWQIYEGSLVTFCLFDFCHEFSPNDPSAFCRLFVFFDMRYIHITSPECSGSTSKGRCPGGSRLDVEPQISSSSTPPHLSVHLTHRDRKTTDWYSFHTRCVPSWANELMSSSSLSSSHSSSPSSSLSSSSSSSSLSLSSSPPPFPPPLSPPPPPFLLPLLLSLFLPLLLSSRLLTAVLLFRKVLI